MQHDQAAEREDHRNHRDLLDRPEQLVGVDERRQRGCQSRKRRPDAVEPDAPCEQPGWRYGGCEREGVERLKGPDQGKAQEQRTAAEEGVGTGGVAAVVVGVDELAIGAAQVQAPKVLPVVDQEVGADHVDGRIREGHEG